ncbi:MAG TPA: TldD/PmbA family protein [Xanthobacteraceae bacterium]|nr:TldD/PmbA family protein [Xanthobacteraceae bacterium]
MAPQSALLDQSRLIAIAEQLAEAARRAGADAADAVAVRSVALSVEVRDGAVEESERSESDDFGLRVLVGRRQAVVSSNDVPAQAVRALAERAVAMARAAPEDPFAGLAEEEALARSIPDLDLLDPTLPSVEQLEELARTAEAAALATPGVSKSAGASASAGIGGLVLVTTHGFRGAYLGSHRSLSMTAIAGQGTAMERDYDFSSAPHAADLEPPERIGRTAGERAVKRLNPQKVATHRVPVVFDRRVAGSLLGHLASAINGAAIARQTSFLKGKLDQQLFGSGIRIIDDPLRRRGLRSRPFDAEGVAGASRALIDEGVLQSWLLDCATARELGLKTTGHASRGVSSVPSPAATNLYLEAGSRSRDELIADIESGFYVTDLIGMGANIVTGDYSRGASGVWIERGALTYPVSEVTIAGHLSDIFRSLEPANDLEFRYGINAPTVRAEGLTVAGR